MSRQTKQSNQPARVHPNAAGLDIGSREIFGCLPPDRSEPTVKRLGTFTPDLYSLADWLTKNGIDTVAMESTGIYWIPIFEILEGRGIAVYLVNARHIKNVPGRKSDVQDCQWLQKRHALGLLTPPSDPMPKCVNCAPIYAIVLNYCAIVHRTFYTSRKPYSR